MDTTSVQDIHFKALDELYKQHTKVKLLSETSAWDTVLDALDFFEEMPSLKNNISIEITGWSHGDFTPWNMYITQDKLYLYDWEMSQKDMPLLLDICHYVFQKNILIKRSSFAEIDQEFKAFQQGHLHEQAHWLMDTWLEAMDALPMQTGVVAR